VSARLALDEMFSPQIAAELVRRGHDVVAVAADPALAGLPARPRRGRLAHVATAAVPARPGSLWYC